MSSIDEDAIKNFAVDRLGLTKEEADALWMIGLALVGAEFSWVVILIGAYDFLDKYFASSGSTTVQQKLQQIENHLNTLEAKQAADEYGDIVNTVNGFAEYFDAAGVVIDTFRTSLAAPTRDALSKKVEEGELGEKLGNLLGPERFRFIPQVYGNPDWRDGRIAFYVKYDYKPGSPQGFDWWPTWYRFQVYEQPVKHLDTQWALPDPLLKVPIRWDGLLSLPVLLYALPLWQTALTLLEPFYQLTGHWKKNIDGISGAMGTFANFWESSLVWTREMPSTWEVAQSGSTTYWNIQGGGSVAGSKDPQQSGFYAWPCGVLDPVMGIEICNPYWWTCTGWNTGHRTYEMMTDAQRAGFRQLRESQLQKLYRENGLDKFRRLTDRVKKLGVPPYVSPSLAAHSKLLQVQHTSQTKLPAETVTDPGGTDWTGQVLQSSVAVKGPISVQPNPAPPAPQYRRAQTDVVFGYEITFTPTGGSKQIVQGWSWPLRLQPGELSLYHDPSQPAPEIRTVPYSIKKEFSGLKATTWKTVTDGKNRDQIDEAPGEVTFAMTVTVWDQVDPKIPLVDPSAPQQVQQQQDIWKKQHGVIVITIEADANANHGRSFEVIVEVKETAAVDILGNPDTNLLKKTYTAQMPIPVDIYQITVPTGYFEWLRRILEAIRYVKKQWKIPIPDPEPELLLELPQWRLDLGKNRSLLDAHVHELKRITGRSSLTPEQALTDLDAAVSKLAGLASRESF